MSGSPPDRDPLLGKLVAGRYQVIRRIGRGGMGSIYEVTHTKLGRAFAMKTLSWEMAGDKEILARFQREADIVAKLRHPNIVEIVDWDAIDDGTPCLIMEYLKGEDLGKRIRGAGPLPWSVIARVGDQLLSALVVAHRAGIVHRDLKPQNIFIAQDDAGEERAKLLDFGVSKIRGSQSFATTDARLIGTPAYMSPEQADGSHEDVGPATDVWAMGAILYEMATGRLAFDAGNVPSILYRICHREPDRVADHRSDAPAAFADLIDRALSRDPARRLTEADTLRAELRKALAGLPDVAYAEPLRAPAGKLEPTPAPQAAFDATLRSTPGAAGKHGHAAPTPAVPATVSLESGSAARVDPIAATESGASAVPEAPPEQPTTLSSTVGQSVKGIRADAARRRPWLLIGAGVAVAAVAAVVLAMKLGGDGDGDDREQVAAPVPPPPVERVPAPPPDPVPPVPAPAPVQFKIDSVPTGADVYRDDVLVGTTPFTDKVDPEVGKQVFRLQLGGFADKKVELDSRGVRERSVVLARKPKPAGGATAGSKPCRKKGEPPNPFDKRPPCK